MPTLVAANALGKVYELRAGWRRTTTRVEAVKSVTFTVDEGRALALVGESGSGKSTVARLLVGLESPTSGTVAIDGRELSRQPSRRERRARARLVQIVFQDPYTSLDPHQTPRQALEEVIRFHFGAHGAALRSQALEVLGSVGLSQEANAFPRQLSGGQRQRVAIARALAARPRVLVLDEPVSALDVSVQAQVLNLLADIRDASGIAYVFISHDLAVVRQFADYVLVMHRGEVVEEGEGAKVLTAPEHPYTRRLLASVPRAPDVVPVAVPAGPSETRN